MQQQLHPKRALGFPLGLGLGFQFVQLPLHLPLLVLQAAAGFLLELQFLLGGGQLFGGRLDLGFQAAGLPIDRLEFPIVLIEAIARPLPFRGDFRQLGFDLLQPLLQGGPLRALGIDRRLDRLQLVAQVRLLLHPSLGRFRQLRRLGPGPVQVGRRPIVGLLQLLQALLQFRPSGGQGGLGAIDLRHLRC